MPTAQDCRYMASQFACFSPLSVVILDTTHFCGRTKSLCFQQHWSELVPPRVSCSWMFSNLASYHLRLDSLMVCRSSRSSLGRPAGARSIPRDRPCQLVASHHRCRRDLQRRPSHWLHNICWQEKGHCSILIAANITTSHWGSACLLIYFACIYRNKFFTLSARSNNWLLMTVLWK